jgi:AraC-like DNA-binding protein
MPLPAIPDWWPDQLLQQNPIIEVFACGRKSQPPLYSHFVNFPRLEIPLHGIYANKIDRHGRLIPLHLHPGQALFAAPNCWNLPAWRPGLQLMSLLFGKKQMGVSIVSVPAKKKQKLSALKFFLPRPVTGPVPHILEAILDLSNTADPAAPLPELTRTLIWCVRDLFRQPAIPASSRAHNLLENICIHLQEHYQRNVTRDAIAHQFRISPNHLSRLFQTHGHMTFNSYLTHVRIDRAKFMLQNYELKLDDLATRCGYHDTPYFCRVFKRIAKITPVEYRLRTQPKPAL